VTFRLFAACVALVGLSAAWGVEPDFALHDGDTVVFLGDSITAARGYTKVVELYTLMRFPDRRVRFWNAGKGGDTASAAVDRLERDVFSHKPTVVTVALGVNDIGWGMKADAQHKQLYLDGIRRIVGECQKRNVRVFICSPAITNEHPDKAEQGFLQKMADEGMALAQSLVAGSIDISRGMREIQRKVVQANEKEADKSKHTELHVKDGVHLNELGQLAMAYAMLKGLGAPADVSQATLDAKSSELVSASGCEITGVKTLADGLEFTRKDVGLPLNLGVLSALQYRFIPVPSGINRYMLTVKNLAPGRYTLRAEGRLLGNFTASNLASGLNISSMTADGWEPGGPWDAQSSAVKELVDARDKLWMAGRVRALHNSDNPSASALEDQAKRQDDDLVAHQRAIARPYPYRFEIRKMNEPSK
jgi:lysophospholipase L1-like esterase